MDPYLEAAVERMRRADANAKASTDAFAAGPDAFLKYIEQQAAEARARINVGTNDDEPGDAEEGTDASGTGGGEVRGSGARAEGGSGSGGTPRSPEDAPPQ
jgi:hypothetical protein